ncbi:MAG: 1-deoxy-D-xylulose-5-phosphate synthase [Candidatus Nitrospinota bacterium M3_3B_026]
MKKIHEYEILERIEGPEDIKSLPVSALPELAREVRARIIDVVSRSGGHLASSLGVVELTIALHYVYDLPGDKIVWDVGHQCYAHKILTGRNKTFDTLRKAGGVSGFPSREESLYDCFNTGHAGTSISAALGLARARDHQGGDNDVIAVIGDGSLTAGLAFEGLNHAGATHTGLTVVLNDNKMSISRNVGALSQHLNRIITGKWYTKIRDEFDHIVNALAGGQVAQFTRRFEEAVKSVIVPGRLFEDLGYKYVGPIDGHEIEYLVETFQAVRELKGPRLVHVVTTKGKGYPPAEEKAPYFHGVAPFHPETGDKVNGSSGVTYTDVFSETLMDLAADDERIAAITAAMPQGTGLDGFASAYPDRFYDVGIAEQHGATFAAGLAAEGMKPVVAVYSTFLQRVFDQIVHDVCLMNLDVTFAVDRAGIVGEDGVTHQGLFDLSYLRLAPNMIVMAPKDGLELRRMLKTALDYPGPAALRYPRGAAARVERPEKVEPLPVGKAEVLREGDDLCIMAVGSMVLPALEAAERLGADGLSVAVVNARFVKPIDEKIIEKMARSCGLLLTVEENVLAGGFGSAVLEAVESMGLSRAAVRRLGVPDVFVSHGSQAGKRRELRLDAGGIERTARELLAGEKPGLFKTRRPSHAKKAAGYPSC